MDAPRSKFYTSCPKCSRTKAIRSARKVEQVAQCYSIYLEFCSVSCIVNARYARSTWTNSDYTSSRDGTEVVGREVFPQNDELEIYVVRSSVKRYRRRIIRVSFRFVFPYVPPRADPPSCKLGKSPTGMNRIYDRRGISWCVSPMKSTPSARKFFITKTRSYSLLNIFIRLAVCKRRKIVSCFSSIFFILYWHRKNWFQINQRISTNVKIKIEILPQFINLPSSLKATSALTRALRSQMYSSADCKVFFSSLFFCFSDYR